MFTRKGYKPKPKTVNCILLDGGLGDHIASLVAVNYILKKYTWIKLLIWVPDYLLDFAKHVLPKTASINNFTSMKTLYNPGLTTKTTKWDGITSPMKIHLLDYAFLKLCDENPAIEHKNYLQIDSHSLPEQLYEDYVVITAGYTAKAREFKAKYINEITSYIVSKGYQPVFLGATKTMTGTSYTIEGNFDKKIDFSKSINLINKTTLLEAAKIMASSAAVIGVDNGLLHLAGCTQVPIVGGFPSVSPEIRATVRHNMLGWNYYSVVPDADKGCNFCQENTNFLYGHDYRECIYKDDRSINGMTATKFIEKLELILK